MNNKDKGYYAEVGRWSGTEEQQTEGKVERDPADFLYLSPDEFKLVRAILSELREDVPLVVLKKDVDLKEFQKLIRGEIPEIITGWSQDHKLVLVVKPL